ncbi:uncharacterized protein LOC109703724 [Ananas comosus]|uniref:Uncharacterized protein LOC109703724 n=1 Tax=Ananas comosus TaxID=4615 RepID=A0A6P5EAG1_ANACO|nr:uncharacterized protein LOC109703724 [Ananas comosus]
MSKQRVALLGALLLAVVSNSYADLYGNPSPPPPSRVSGREFPPDNSTGDDGTRCAGIFLTCPSECPSQKPGNPNDKACVVDCNNPKCEPSCTSRTPNCDNKGSGCKDPRFVGADGAVFYFHGHAGRHFALVSDPNLQINARFVGFRPAGRRRDFTWIQSLGIRFGAHAFTVAAVTAPSWDPRADHLSLTFDGAPINLDPGHLSSWTADGLRVERSGTVNTLFVTLPNVFEISATVTPVTKEDDRIHRYGIPEGDCFAHLDVQFKIFKLSERVEGVLGQTYRPDFYSPVKQGVPMPVMGGEDRYETSALLSANCRSCVFAPEVAAVTEAIEVNPTVVDCTSNGRSGYAVVCRR